MPGSIRAHRYRINLHGSRVSSTCSVRLLPSEFLSPNIATDEILRSRTQEPTVHTLHGDHRGTFDNPSIRLGRSFHTREHFTTRSIPTPSLSHVLHPALVQSSPAPPGRIDCCHCGRISDKSHQHHEWWPTGSFSKLHCELQFQLGHVHDVLDADGDISWCDCSIEKL